MSVIKYLGVATLAAAAIAATIYIRRKQTSKSSVATSPVSELSSSAAETSSTSTTATEEQPVVKSEVITELELNLREAFRVLWDNRSIDGLAVEYNSDWDTESSSEMLFTSPLIEEGAYAYCTDAQGRHLLLIGSGDCNIAVYREQSGEIHFRGPNVEDVGGAWYVFQLLDTLCDVNEAIPLAAAA